MNCEFKIAIFKRFGSAIEAAKETGIHESCISHFVRGHRRPNRREREKLLKFFSPYQLRRFFPKPTPRFERDHAVNE